MKIGGGGQQKGAGQNQQKQQNGVEGGGKKQNNQQPQGWRLGKAEEIANQFIHYRDKYTSYQLSFAFWETFNLVTVLASIQATHWLLNNKFWWYGLEVITYLNNYQSHHQQGVKLHDPMCEVFPTEVGCAYNYGGEAGQTSSQEILCILGNNLFNQKYFFVLWIWWMFLLVISVFGLIFRLLRVCFRAFSKAMLMRKSHGRHFNGVRISSSEAFVLELVLDNLGKTPTFATKVMRDVAARLKEQNLKDYDRAFGYDVQTPLFENTDVRHNDTPVVKTNFYAAGDAKPFNELKSYHPNTLHQAVDTNLLNFHENSQKESTNMTCEDRAAGTMFSDVSLKDKGSAEESNKLSAKERKKLKKEARKLKQNLEHMPQVKEETENCAEEILVKTEEPSVEPFPELPRPCDKSVASFPGNSICKSDWL